MVETFLSKIGYAIPLTDENFKKTNKALSVYPKETSKIKYTFVKPKPVLCFRKSKRFLYLPRYYGYLNYGKPDEIKSEVSVTKTELIFNGQLRDYQEKIVKRSIEKLEDEHTRGGLLALGTGTGKCMAKDTPIIMYDGSIKMVQDVKVGDQLMGDDSTPRNVLSLARGKEEMCEIKPSKGESYTVNRSHILSLRCTSDHSKKYKKNHIIDISVEDYLKQNDKFKHMYKGYKVPVIFKEKETPFDPYLLGLWLGDGSSSASKISNQDSSILIYLKQKLPEYKCYLQYTNSGYDYRINGYKQINYVWDEIKKLNLVNNKHIPGLFKINSKENRLSLLAGLIDSDGYYDKKGKGYEITQKNKRLSDDILYLCRSLGFGTYQKKCKKKCTNSSNKNHEGIYYRINISGEELEKIPCLVPRKKAEKRKQKKNVLNYGFKVIEKGIGNYYGFTLDGNRRYILGDFTVTHNTAIALYLSSVLKVKTLVLVHKEILLQQWIERIEQFLPEAKIGKIQGTTIDIEDKDIILGMVQSISQKEYDPQTFEGIGLTVVDECHFINSKVFSKTLFKIQSKYRLGLSATPKRADGLDKVIEYHIGPIIYTMDNTILDPVIHFINAPPTTVAIQTMRGGNVNLSKLITDISKEEERNKFIIETLDRYSLENRNVIVFSDRVEHCKTLNFLFGKLNNGKTSGVFIGKMKKEEREHSLEQNIIFCSYSMAKEGFDLPKLDTLLFATPKSNVVQCVGRILRRKNENIPVVIDLLDSNYGVLTGQYYKRKRYYKSKEYEIYNYKEGELVREEQIKKKKEEKAVCKIRTEE